MCMPRTSTNGVQMASCVQQPTCWPAAHLHSSTILRTPSNNRHTVGGCVQRLSPFARRPLAEALAVCAYPADTGTLAARHCSMWKEEGWIQAQAQAPRNSVAAGGRYSEGRWDALFTAGHTPADRTQHSIS